MIGGGEPQDRRREIETERDQCDRGQALRTPFSQPLVSAVIFWTTDLL
jgi:hypothetical protein